MIIMFFEYALLALLLIGGGLASMAVWSRQSNWMRATAVAGFLIMLPVMVSTSLLSLGHPMPSPMLNLLPSGNYEVLDAKFIQNKAIYVWFDIVGGTPLSVSFPWNNDLADRLWGMLNPREERMEGWVTMSISEEPSLYDGEKMFHAPPPRRAPPPKPIPEAPPEYIRELDH